MKKGKFESVLFIIELMLHDIYVPIYKYLSISCSLLIFLLLILGVLHIDLNDTLEMNEIQIEEPNSDLQMQEPNQTPNIKKFECSICGKHVRNQKTLINHIRRVHTGMKPYQCSVCKQKYKVT